MQQLRLAVSRAGMQDDIFERIQTQLVAEPAVESGFEPAHIAYYLGAILIIGAMGWFVTSAWDRLSGISMTLIALLYGIVFGGVGLRLSKRQATRVPGGVLVTVAVCMTPLAVYGIERQLGWWPAGNPGSYTRFHPLIDASWVMMELFTVLVSFIGLRLTQFPFITAPAAYALWYLSMDGTALIFGKHWTFHQEAWISVAFGLVMMVIAYALEAYPVDLSFWFYLFGLLCFTGGLSSMDSNSQLGKAIYCLVHLLLMVLSVVLQRRAFLIFGACGVFFYLAGEATGFFKDSFAFTIALTVIGILFIVGGMAYKRNEAELTRLLSPWIPQRIRHRDALEMV